MKGVEREETIKIEIKLKTRRMKELKVLVLHIMLWLQDTTGRLVNFVGKPLHMDNVIV